MVEYSISFYCILSYRNKELFSLSLPKIVAVAISPLNNWLITLTPFKTDPNLQIWSMKTHELHYALIQKSFSRSVHFFSVFLADFLVLALFAMGLPREESSFPQRWMCKTSFPSSLSRSPYLTVKIWMMFLLNKKSPVEAKVYWCPWRSNRIPWWVSLLLPCILPYFYIVE